MASSRLRFTNPCRPDPCLGSKPPCSTCRSAHRLCCWSRPANWKLHFDCPRPEGDPASSLNGRAAYLWSSPCRCTSIPGCRLVLESQYGASSGRHVAMLLSPMIQPQRGIRFWPRNRLSCLDHPSACSCPRRTGVPLHGLLLVARAWARVAAMLVLSFDPYVWGCPCPNSPRPHEGATARVGGPAAW